MEGYRKLEVGQKRIRTGYLVFPKTINGERRWRKEVSFEQELVEIIQIDMAAVCPVWIDTRWIDDNN